MRFKIMRQGGYASAGLSSAGGTLSGPLILSGNPLQTMEAVNKSYVDGILTNINATNLTTGTLNAARLPAFTGDVTNTEGSASLTLKASGVTPGSYPKVAVNTKGLVTNGYTLSASDIPSVSWTKVVSGKPTTLAGYGITDAVPPEGGTVTGVLEVSQSPADPLHVVNKTYVDGLSAPSVSNVTGDIIRRFDPVTPGGYLRCNGGLVSKTTYPALYAIFGDNANIQTSTAAGSGQPWRQQYEFNTTQSADVTGWSSGVTPTTNDIFYCLAPTKDRVYALGLYDGSNYTRVFVAPINANGTIGAWSATTSLPSSRGWSEAVVTKNRIYMIGGYNGSTYISSTVTAPINSDGTLGAWVAGPSLPAPRLNPVVFSTKTRVYAIGGYNGNNHTSSVYSAPINADGTLDGWVSEAAYPLALSESTSAVTKNRVYVLGGYIGSKATSAVYTAPINADGTLGAWTAANPLPEACSGSEAVVTKNRVYFWGGVRGTGYATSGGYSAPINADGTLGTWAACPPLPQNVNYSYPIVTNSKIYLYGGTEGFLPVCYVAPFSGGLNDYSTFYTTGYSATDPDNFQLPDYTGRELDGSYTYIKI